MKDDLFDRKSKTFHQGKILKKKSLHKIRNTIKGYLGYSGGTCANNCGLLNQRILLVFLLKTTLPGNVHVLKCELNMILQ